MTDMDAATRAIRIERLIDAPIELIWRMWTEPDLVQAWYGPAGATVPVAELDVRVGGVRRVCMTVDTPAGPRDMWFIGTFVAVEAGRRLVYTESMSDAAGNVLSPAAMGMGPDFPVTTEVSIELSDEGGRTRLVLAHAGMPADSPGAEGWRMALDKLELLAQERAR